MEADGKNEKVFGGLENNFFLQWGNRKRLRCVKIRDNNTTNNNTVAVDSDNKNNRNNNTQKLRTASRINRRVLNIEKERLHPSSSPNGILREWESWGSESKKSSQPSSPDKEENRFYSTRGSTAAAAAAPHPALADNNNGNGHIGAEEKVGKVGLPRFFISLSSKEKEEDFMAMKGCKLPQRPKKRAKLVQRTILLVSPGAWLSDLSHERYEVREKKSRKRKRGLKVISIESDSE